MNTMLAWSLYSPVPSVHEWFAQVDSAGGGIGLILLGMGVALLLFGHQMCRLTTSVALGGLGAATGYLIGQEAQWTASATAVCVFAAAIVCGVLGFRLVRIGGAVLGGVTALFMMHVTLGVHVSSPVVSWALLGGVFAVAVAFSFIHYDHMIMISMAVLGALLVVSGFVAFAGTMPNVLTTCRHMMLRYSIVVWIAFLTPAVVGFTYQMAEFRHRSGQPKV